MTTSPEPREPRPSRWDQATDAGYDCDNCALAVDPDDAAPSCGSHFLHVGCHEWFQCRHCTDAMREIDAERDGAWLA